jgi:hypothetical protein
VLLEYYPEAAKIPGKKCGSLPLHIASTNGCDAEILKMLFEAYPQALEKKNSVGDTPLECGAGHVSLPPYTLDSSLFLGNFYCSLNSISSFCDEGHKPEESDRNDGWSRGTTYSRTITDGMKFDNMRYFL